MKRMLKKVTAVLLAALVVAVGSGSSVAKAAGNDVVIHVKDGAGWESMNVYNWGDGGETAGAWPGTAMEADADGWYTYTITTEVDLNLVFSATGGAPQSNNVDGVSKDLGEIWVVVGGEGEENDMGVAGDLAVLYTEPEEGWPVAAAEVVTTAEAQDETPKTGDVAPILPIAIVALGSLFLVVASFAKKKENA